MCGTGRGRKTCALLGCGLTLLPSPLQAVAEMIKGKSPDEIKAIFGIEGEFTEEEKKAVFEEHEWLREDAEEAKAEGDAAGAKE